MIPRSVHETPAPIPCSVHVRCLPVAYCDLDSLSHYVATLTNPVILGANCAQVSPRYYSYWAAEPVEVLSCSAQDLDPLGFLEKGLAHYRLGTSPVPSDLPRNLFKGGWMGYFAYELGRLFEKLPGTNEDELGWPLIRLGFYDRVIAYDHQASVVWFLALGLKNEAVEPDLKLDQLEKWYEAAQSNPVKPSPAATEMGLLDITALDCNMTQPAYLQAIKRILKYIRDGETYQINFSQRFSCSFDHPAIDLFHWQNRYNPSPYAAYLAWPDAAIVSASPELFVHLRNGFIQTKPIKGTRARRGNTENELQDRQQQQDLWLSEKERAELNMIVDLERNDFARICLPGTRRVLQERVIEAYPTVFHAVASVGGQLRPELGLVDILRSIFPGGSITGAPKIRSMEIIDELEPTARGVYTGSIGAIGIEGDVCLNIAIRTIMIAHKWAYVQVGGGIVADSNPLAEYEETLIKARALLAGIAACRNQTC